MNRHADLLELQDLDLLLRMLGREGCRARLRRLGFTFDPPGRLARRRERLAARIEPRWIGPYERAAGRYGRGLVAVRERVCTVAARSGMRTVKRSSPKSVTLRVSVSSSGVASTGAAASGTVSVSGSG